MRRHLPVLLLAPLFPACSSAVSEPLAPPVAAAFDSQNLTRTAQWALGVRQRIVELRKSGNNLAAQTEASAVGEQYRYLAGAGVSWQMAFVDTYVRSVRL